MTVRVCGSRPSRVQRGAEEISQLDDAATVRSKRRAFGKLNRILVWVATRYPPGSVLVPPTIEHYSGMACSGWSCPTSLRISTRRLTSATAAERILVRR